ncbi:granzyme A-like [Pseudonaja textilis]|uniref:granzyme A-like n=1 Tax=Pseudonaja textilis TaxID=8673 RepID=UPI000EA9D3B2|nr:granzyme A-like [Pseudonaja textilis]
MAIAKKAQKHLRFLTLLKKNDLGQSTHIFDEEEHSIPYMVGIIKHKHLLCAGTFIKHNWVLTAAHCFPDEETYIGVGSQAIIKDEGKGFINITKVFFYPGFNPKTFENNIMLLKLHIMATKLKINVLPLPNSTHDLKPGTMCTVKGWGTTSKRRRFKKFRAINVTIIDRNICNDKKHYNSHPFVTMKMVCAGDKNSRKDLCVGDSGGPLICSGKQRGIVSFVKRCDQPENPGIYTQLTDTYISWIKTMIDENSH